jgi:2-polyprenyl-6-methoxyphenol hydroxylase-like FAD-dependent oxidoreductase
VSDFDVVVVGAGVAGGALATRLARDGLRILIIERTLRHVDRIRGENILPWGVHEATELGILDVLLEAGGHYNTKGFRFGLGIPIELARASQIDLSAMVPGVRGAMSFGHPRLCDTLDKAATDAGATLLRGVSAVAVEPGPLPKISFEHDGETHAVRPRLVVGADGRGSVVARQLELKVQTEPVHHLIAGLLVDGVHSWPDDEVAGGIDERTYNLVFPQGSGRIRLYLCYPSEERGRFSGPRAAENFLAAFRGTCVPYANEIAAARIAGPCQGYPNADTWVDQPTAPGVVLIGDAAGHNDPTIGQGLSIAMRDARMVAEILSGSPDWDQELFEPYVAERHERMRRLRHFAHVTAVLRCEFDEEAKRRRGQAARQLVDDPSLGLLFAAGFKGAFSVPDEMFEQPTLERLFGERWLIASDGWLQRPSRS